MRYLSLFICNCSLALMGFSQSSQTVTLVFVSSGSDSHKNYEAVIDDVSYFSKNNSSGDSQQTSAGQGNTIWLNNFQPGRHSIKVYNIRNGSTEERADNSPVDSSTFNVKYGFKTNIAVKSNGQVQFSERLSNNDTHSDNVAKKIDGANSTSNVYSANDKIPGNENDDFDKKYKKKKYAPAVNQNDSNISVNTNFDGHERHSRKRLDTAIVYNDEKNDSNLNAPKNSKAKLRSQIRIRKSNSTFDDQHKDNNTKAPMNDDQFNEFYETVRNQWLPGQKMKTLSNKFLNAEDNFSTAQAKQLIKLLTEEGNRLKLAKAVYPCITDPENFSDLDDLLRYKKSKAELDNFISEGGKE